MPIRSTAFASLGATAVLLAACGGPPATPEAQADPAKTEAEVKAAILTQLEAYEARDAAKAASILAPDVVSMFHGAPNVVGQPAALASIQKQMADPALKLSVADPTVDVALAGDMAVYSATYAFTFTDPSTQKPITETGNWVAIFERQSDGAMKLSRDMVLDAPAPSSR